MSSKKLKTLEERERESIIVVVIRKVQFEEHKGEARVDGVGREAVEISKER